MVEPLPSKHEALSSNPYNVKKRGKKRGGGGGSRGGRLSQHVPFKNIYFL
jgi:hypothetical protein